MNVTEWPPSWRDLIGTNLPSSYCSVDLETTGFSKDYDLIVEYGHCLVDNGQVVDRLNLVLDWTRHPIIPQGWLAQQLDYVRNRMAERGMTYHMTMRRLRDEGIDPIKGLNFIYEFLSTLRSNGSFFTTHNGYRFDEDMLAHSFVGFEVCQTRFSFGDFSLFDTQAIEKSRVCARDPKARVRTDDTLRSWCKRLCYMNSGRLRTDLLSCANKYRLPEKYGIDMAMAHTAGFDAYLTHLLFQEQCASVAPADTPSAVIKVAAPSKAKPTVETSVTPIVTPTTGMEIEPQRRRRGQRNR